MILYYNFLFLFRVFGAFRAYFLPCFLLCEAGTLVLYWHQPKGRDLGVGTCAEEDRSDFMANAEYEVDLIINSNYKFIDIGHDLVKYLCNLIGFDEDTTHWIILALREGISNAIKHGNRCDMSKKVIVRMSYDNKQLDISIEDQGVGFDPGLVQNPLLPENLLKPTGRGIFYIKSFMDEVQYEFKQNHGTILRMKKILQTP